MMGDKKSLMINKQNKKYGLVLSVGAAQGLAHIGVIKVLREQGFIFDVVTGSSMGALIGACYAKDGDILKVERTILDIDVKQMSGLIDPKFSVLSKGLISGDKVKEFLKSIIGDIEFKDLKIPLAVVATDINTGEEVVFSEGSVVEAVRASISMPGVFVPVKINDRYLTDGGSVNPLPVDLAKKMGAEYIIVSNIVPSPIKRGAKLEAKKKQEARRDNLLDKLFKKYFWAKKPEDDIPDMVNSLSQAMHILEYKIINTRLKEADLVITPDAQEIGTLDFSKAKEAIVKGEEAARKKFEKSVA